MSKRKFDYAGFIGDFGYCIAFDAEKYGCAEARKIAEIELNTERIEEELMFCYYGFGVTDDGEKELRYAINEYPVGNSFSVCAFRRAKEKEKAK